jgi:hypothetical protein
MSNGHGISNINGGSSHANGDSSTPTDPQIIQSH